MLEDLQKKLDSDLARLREQWKSAGPNHKKLIQIRADLLKRRFEEKKIELENEQRNLELASKLFVT